MAIVEVSIGRYARPAPKAEVVMHLQTSDPVLDLRFESWTILGRWVLDEPERP